MRFGFLLFSLFAGAVQQSTLSTAPPSVEEIQRFFASPDRADAGITALWEKLGIPDPWDGRCVECKTTTISLSRTGNIAPDTLIEIAAAGGRYRDLVFGTDGTTKLRGYVDLTNQTTERPLYQSAEIGNETWLVIRASWGESDQTSLSGQTWYSRDLDGLHPVLTFPVSGNGIFAGNTLSTFQGRITGQDVNAEGAYRVSVEFSITYAQATEDGPLPLFSKRQIGVFVRPGGQQEFRLDDTASTLSEEEINSIYSIDPIDGEHFLLFNQAQLENLAQHGDEGQRLWLLRLLTQIQDTPAKARLYTLAQH